MNQEEANDDIEISYFRVIIKVFFEAKIGLIKKNL